MTRRDLSQLVAVSCAAVFLAFGCSTGVHTTPASETQGMTDGQFLHLFQEVRIGTSRKDAVTFLKKHGIENSGYRERFHDQWVYAILRRHERMGWNPSVQAVYEIKNGKVSGYTYRSLHLP